MISAVVIIFFCSFLQSLLSDLFWRVWIIIACDQIGNCVSTCRRINTIEPYCSKSLKGNLKQYFMVFKWRFVCEWLLLCFFDCQSLSLFSLTFPSFIQRFHRKYKIHFSYCTRRNPSHEMNNLDRSGVIYFDAFAIDLS